MFKPRPCGCKGVRTCLVCEADCGTTRKQYSFEEKTEHAYIYCPLCDKAWPGWNISDIQFHPDHEGQAIDYPGVLVQYDFLNENEASELMKGIDATPWDLSQSGRRKQNFGPKCNFKKKKLVLGNFKGFPKFSEFVQQKLSCVPLLNNFQTIEQCSLEYCPKRGASIDPHIDDCWIWGERIVTVNVKGDSVLTMTHLADKDRLRYNLNLAPEEFKEFNNEMENIIVRIPMPAKSLIVLYNQARYQWEHCVLRNDVPDLRVCLAYREFTAPYLEGGSNFNDQVEKVMVAATNFWDNL